MTAATCTYADEEVAAALDRLRDVTSRLHNSQDTTRSLAVERRSIIAALRSRRVPLRVLGDAMGMQPENVWALTPAANRLEVSK
ncbi:hypothetical protein [Mycolicibacterium brumae]|uniref:Uncharacterized protein n=1 Tax=Mycolicibacterium brumae TaxID=85968 RepID=A0A2G5P8J5_9MYCO|nr:hypothetical protein [Mycolicibacterium brumae]MCV7194106.1 hypothetical protein [Mycolicibacterium brumae]PIB74420.1 hypothetical protein CQY22_013205 [Mycolicibacterium brumae]RWA22721.1 hypothetical protein MBRU_12285 [Mycolicibacterium brumae DSM 44177]UWW07473.1 hypothetical protein L2Z93_000488 [Mycolicibacterium brumae]